tara:strand:- start:4000 stop:4287 length:288 start_codon:yes stop_codon:yes gene_type:complete
MEHLTFDGLPFGSIDNLVVILGAYVGALSIDRYFEGKTAQGAIYGAAIGNTVSDCLGALIDPSMRSMVLGITIGCILPITLIPIIEFLKNKKASA